MVMFDDDFDPLSDTPLFNFCNCMFFVKIAKEKIDAGEHGEGVHQLDVDCACVAVPRDEAQYDDEGERRRQAVKRNVINKMLSSVQLSCVQVK